MSFCAGFAFLSRTIICISGYPVTTDVLPVTLVVSISVSALLVLLAFVLLWLYYGRKISRLEKIIARKTEELLAEKGKTADMLSNVLPRNAAEEIAAKGKAAKIKYNFVTVLFSDIQGFTKIAEETNPEILIDELDKFFFHFDSVVEKYGIEKIKTIGDAYMCAGGIPEKNRTNPVEVILAALEMQSYMARLKESTELEGMKFWDIRIGIHTGTVVAGVVGHKKLSYDIWGDTVNTASRMESSGEGGKINISGTTHEFVKEFFECEYRGKMPVKYKGEVDMYFVKRIIPELCDEQGMPNERFVLKMQKIKLQDIEEVVLKLFDDEASPDLYFHNSAMVRNICMQVDLISTAERLPDEEYVMLKLAAMLLFTGYITNYDSPLDESLRYAGEILPRYGFTAGDIGTVGRLIRNSYSGNVEGFPDRILHDARYDYLGRVDYLKLTDKLLRELTWYGKHVDIASWLDLQKKLLEDHPFYTDTARLLRTVTVEDQIAGLLASAS
jgi:adenylate cyclase